MHEPLDEVLEKVTRELSAMPPVREEAIERIVALAAAQRAAARARFEPLAEEAYPRAQPRWSRWWAGGATAAALAALLWAGIARRAAERGAPAVAAGGAEVETEAQAGGGPLAGAVAVADLAATDAEPRPVQFVLDAPGARGVAVVGGFNDWDPAATRLERVPGTTVWTATVRLAPGRYTYAFVVDDSTWVLDPRAPRAEDPDYGVESSVLLVGRE